MCSGSEAGSYLRLIGFVHHSTLGLRVIKKRDKPSRVGADAMLRVRFGQLWGKRVVVLAWNVFKG